MLISEKRNIKRNQIYYISMSLKSFEMPQLIKVCLSIKKMLTVLGLKYIKVAFLPTKKQLLTICRSPHIDKKSREQFAIIRHKIYMSFEIPNISSFYTSLFLLKTSNLPGVELKLRVRYKSYFFN